MQELTFVLLDCSVYMLEEHRLLAKRSLSLFLQNRMLTRPEHEVCIILYGSDHTVNELHTEYEVQDPTQYCHINVIQKLGKPSLATIGSLEVIRENTSGIQNADYIDTLIVALHSLNHEVESRPELLDFKRHIMLISAFSSPTISDSKGETVDTIVDAMRSLHVKLDVIAIVTGRDKKPCMSELLSICDRCTSSIQHIHSPLDILGIFKLKEKPRSSSYFSGFLEMGEDEADIKIKMYKKTSQERFPTLGKESKISAGSTEDAHRDTTYIKTGPSDEEGEEVEASQLIKGFRYGSEIIPVDEVNEKFLAYRPPKSLKLIGFAPASDVPRYSYMKDVWLMTGDKGSQESLTSIAALAHALHDREKVAILRWISREGYQVTIYVAHPVVSAENRPAHFLLNALPFMEDVRSFKFTSFERHLPTESQVDVAAHFVDALTLDDDVDPLKPESVVNPALQCFLNFMNQRALQPNISVSTVIDEDPILQLMITSPLQGEAAGRSSQMMEALNTAFPTGTLAKAERLAVHRLRRDNVEKDLETMFKQGSYSNAADQMRRLIEQLVDESVGERGYDSPLYYTELLRQKCVEWNFAIAFNFTLRQICRQYRMDAVRRVFWARLVERGVALISDAEVPGSDVSEEDARSWLHEQC